MTAECSIGAHRGTVPPVAREKNQPSRKKGRKTERWGVGSIMVRLSLSRVSSRQLEEGQYRAALAFGAPHQPTAPRDRAPVKTHTQIRLEKNGPPALPRLVVVVLLLLVMVGRVSAGGAHMNEGGVAVAASSRDGAVVLQTLSRRLKTKIAALAPASKVRESITEAMGDLRQGDVVLLEKADEADSKAVAAAARTPPDLKVAAREQEKATGLRRDAAARKARGLRAFESLASILSLVEEASQFAELLSLEVDKRIELENFSEANQLSKGLAEVRSQIKTLQQSDEYRAVQAQLHRDEEGATDEQGAGGGSFFDCIFRRRNVRVAAKAPPAVGCRAADSSTRIGQRGAGPNAVR